MIFVDKQKIIGTYSAFDRISCAKHQDYLDLIKENPSFGYKKCAKILGINKGQTRWWHTNGPKKAVPIPLKTVKKLESIGLLPFDENHKSAEIIFNILGTLFGDGGIDKRLNTVAFISGNKKDVDLWHSDLLEIFSFAQGKTQIIEGGEYGHSFNIRCYDRAVVRFFAALGAPVGSKIVNDYSLPEYFAHLPGSLLVSFLDGLFSSEISVPKFVETKYSIDYFNNFSLSLSKAEFLEQNHLFFMDSIRQYSRKAGLESTPSIKKDRYRVEPRKDGHYTHGYRIFFRTNIPNVLLFNKKFPLRYSAGKKQRLEMQVEKALKDNSDKFIV